MLQMIKILLVSCMSVLFFVSSALTKPAPPEGALDLFEIFREIEEKYEDNDWQATLDELSGFVSKFKNELPLIKEATSPSTIKNFKATYSNLKYSIKAHDLETTEDNFIRFQELFFEILDNYQFPVPPSLEVIRIDLGEVEEAIAEDDFDDIVSEMKETQSYFQILEKDLIRKGVASDLIAGFKNNVASVLADAEGKNKAGVKIGLAQLQKQLAFFSELYK